MSGRPTHVPCARCSAPIEVADKGPVPDYCSRSCRTRSYEDRRRERLVAEIGVELTLRLMETYGRAEGDIVDWVKAQVAAIGRLR